jgi:hypothetical protein
LLPNCQVCTVRLCRRRWKWVTTPFPFGHAINGFPGPKELSARVRPPVQSDGLRRVVRWLPSKKISATGIASSDYC